METTFVQQLMGEFMGTLVLVLLGDGAVAANVLRKTKSEGSGWLLITIGWGLAVTMGVYVSGFVSPGHINPAVTLGMAIVGDIGWGAVIPYSLAQIAGGFVGAVLVWLQFMPHFKATEDQDAILSVFSTDPAIESPVWNLVSETIGTAVLLFGLLAFGENTFTDGLNPIAVGMLITAIGISLGGTTGYAINPARDLGPRLAHQVLPIANKGGSNWGYAWVPILGPFIGGVVGALLFSLVI